MAKVKARKLITTKRLLITANIIALLSFAGAAGFFFIKYNDAKNTSPEKIQEAQTQAIIAEVTKIYALPEDETPTIGRVSDKEAIKKQYPVLDTVENGDYLLIYQKAKKAILYRPSTKKVIKEMPVNLQDQVKIRTVGSEDERRSVEKILTDTNLPFTSGGSSKTSLTGITVVDLSGSNSETAKALAERVKGNVGTLPAGEDKPSDVDLLILVGPNTAVTP